MSTSLVRSFEEVAEMMRNAPPPTADDVTILADGRRLDSAEKVRAWVDEINAERVGAGDDPGS